MFRPNFRAIFRLIFEQVECTIDNAFNLRDLVLQELVKIVVISYVNKLEIKGGPTILPKHVAEIII